MYGSHRKWKTHSSILAWEIAWTEKPGGLVHEVANSWTQFNDWIAAAGHSGSHLHHEDIQLCMFTDYLSLKSYREYLMSPHHYRMGGQCSKLARHWTMEKRLEKAVFLSSMGLLLKFPCLGFKRLAKPFARIFKIWRELIMDRQNPMVTDLSTFFRRKARHLELHLLNPWTISPNLLLFPEKIFFQLIPMNSDFHKMYMLDCSFLSNLSQYPTDNVRCSINFCEIGKSTYERMFLFPWLNRIHFPSVSTRNRMH